jgi:hypothetical protein
MCRYQHNHPLTSRSSGLLRKLTAAQLAKKFSVFYRTRRFGTVFTKSANPSPFSAGWFYSCKIQHNITLRSMPRPQKRHHFFSTYNKNSHLDMTPMTIPICRASQPITLYYAVHKELWLLSQNCSEAGTLTSNCSRWSPYVLSILVAKTTLCVRRAAVWMPAGARDFSDL